MADTGVFATTAQIGYKAGANKSSTSAAETYTNFFIGQAESYINSVTEYNWTDAYSALDVDVKYILQEAASNIAAMYVINYDMSGFTSLGEAQVMMDLLWSRADKCIEQLKVQKIKDFVNRA